MFFLSAFIHRSDYVISVLPSCVNMYNEKPLDIFFCTIHLLRYLLLCFYGVTSGCLVLFSWRTGLNTWLVMPDNARPLLCGITYIIILQHIAVLQDFLFSIVLLGIFTGSENIFPF